MQANTYLKYGSIKGETTAESFKDLITVLSLDWNVSREISSATGTAMDRESSSTRLGDVTITKLQDKASPDLFKEATIGKGLPAVFHITKQGDKVEEIMKIELSFSTKRSSNRNNHYQLHRNDDDCYSNRRQK